MGATTLDFGEPGGDFESLWEFETGLESWLETRGVAPVHLSLWSGRALHGYRTPTKIGGVVVHGAETVLGIRAWDDAYEGLLRGHSGADSVPWVLFDLEKIVRMMLRQSGLAFEILAGPLCASTNALGTESIPAKSIVEAAIHKDILLYYRDRADGIRWDADGLNSQEYRFQIVDAVRCARTGIELMGGRVEFGLDQLLRDVDRDVADTVRALLTDDTVDRSAHELLRDRIATWCQLLESPSDTPLGHQPAGYDWLDELVVEQRLSRRTS